MTPCSVRKLGKQVDKRSLKQVSLRNDLWNWANGVGPWFFLDSVDYIVF